MSVSKHWRELEDEKLFEDDDNKYEAMFFIAGKMEGRCEIRRGGRLGVDGVNMSIKLGGENIHYSWFGGDDAMITAKRFCEVHLEKVLSCLGFQNIADAILAED